ncbi:ABC transporter permease [Jeotgalibacillus salarius]|uniref:ABC transporter permease n=1 Tax=Jeotgalibacillus salarius TaxID=546023 RepID=A0A4Y8LJ15_9BACL|nr:ABC transporter permease [Jeotgalibacillus salarius]TFE02185.1 ABC transporter permease [Jeotgalibacillus salarius]
MHTLRLLQNEWVKLIKKPSALIMGVILVALVATLGGGTAYFTEVTAFWEFVADASTLYAVTILFSIIAAGSTVASEFSSGTIKLLLIRPVRRVKILAAKFLVVILYGVLMLFVLAGASLMIGGLLFGFEPLYINEVNMLGDLAETYLLYIGELVIYAAMAFMISTVFRSSSLAIGLSIFLMFTGPQMTMLAGRYEWAKYILFANTNLTQFKENRVLFEGMTVGFSLAVIAAYLVIFAVVSWQVFQRRDVAV